MKLVKEINFWASLLAFPILFLAALASAPYVFGYVGGYLQNINEYSMKLDHALLALFYIVCVISIWPFVNSVKAIGLRLSTKA